MQTLLITSQEAARRRRALKVFEEAARAVLACPVCRAKVKRGPLLRELKRLERELNMAEAVSGVMRQENLALFSLN